MPSYTMKNFYDSKEYEKAIEYASDSDKRADFSEWDYLYLANCLYKLKNYADFLVLYKEFHSKYPESDKLDDRMGWSLYQIHIKEYDYDKGNRQQYFRQIDYILSHCTETQYSPKYFIASLAADNIMNQKLGVNPNYELADKYLSIIDPTKLDLTEREVVVDGHTVRLASDRERWYNHKTKALVALKEYEKCLEYIDEAFRNVNNFHNKCNHWLNYRKALCYLALNDLETAEKTINTILNQFEHWCFYEVLYKISVLRENVGDAIKYGAKGATTDKNHKLRVSFYENYAKFLHDNGYIIEAALHFKLVEVIRQEENWKEICFPDGYSYPDEISELDEKSIMCQLELFWNVEKERGIDFFEGTIKKILPAGKSGFICDDTGKSYYFNIRDFAKKVCELKEGTRVRYALTEKLDKSKNEVKLNAVQISFVK